jgi:hypothetical protein
VPPEWGTKVLYGAVHSPYGDVNVMDAPPGREGTPGDNFAVAVARVRRRLGSTARSRDVVACMIEAGDGAPAARTVDFWVDDTDAAATRAVQLGGAVVVPPYDTPIFRQAVLADREGAIFSISQLRMRPS